MLCARSFISNYFHIADIALIENTALVGEYTVKDLNRILILVVYYNLRWPDSHAVCQTT